MVQIGRHLSHTEISSATEELSEAVEKWRRRDLSAESVKYIFVDEVNFHMRVQRSIDIIPVLVAIGVDEKGRKLVLSLQSGDKESAGSWGEFFKDLKSRGLAGQLVTLGIMDGLPGLEPFLRKNFPIPKSSAARCVLFVMFWPKFRKSRSGK